MTFLNDQIKLFLLITHIIKVPSGTEVVTLRLKKRSNDFWLVVLEKKI